MTTVAEELAAAAGHLPQSLMVGSEKVIFMSVLVMSGSGSELKLDFGELNCNGLHGVSTHLRLDCA